MHLSGPTIHGHQTLDAIPRSLNACRTHACRRRATGERPKAPLKVDVDQGDRDSGDQECGKAKGSTSKTCKICGEV